MERRDFIQKTILTTAAVAGAGLGAAKAKSGAKDNDVYELRVYHMRRNMAPLDNYLKNALIPTLNRMGVKNVGVFSEWSKSEPAQIYLLIPYAGFEEYGKITVDLKSDKEFMETSSEYIQIPQEQAVFDRYDSSLLLAFDGHPKLTVPPKSRKLFELRTYEGYSEDAVARKVKMFNSAEIDIFREVKLNAVFYSQNVAGKDLPCLTYMAAYDSMDERESVWKAFSAHPEWQKISKLPEYANTVNKIHKTFLEPVSYSQV
jgi:hypothetical protein